MPSADSSVLTPERVSPEYDTRTGFSGVWHRRSRLARRRLDRLERDPAEVLLLFQEEDFPVDSARARKPRDGIARVGSWQRLDRLHLDPAEVLLLLQEKDFPIGLAPQERVSGRHELR